jgi:RNA polymerase sigma-70 factor (ECF subfamily)
MDKKKQETNLEEIYAKYGPVIRFRVRRSLGASNPDWEDIVNEIITNVIEKIKRKEFRGESSIGTFIYTITSRRIIDYIRQKSKVLKHAPEPTPYPDPHEQVENKERAESIVNAIKKLKPKYRDIFIIIKDFQERKLLKSYPSLPIGLANV